MLSSVKCGNEQVETGPLLYEHKALNFISHMIIIIASYALLGSIATAVLVTATTAATK